MRQTLKFSALFDREYKYDIAILIEGSVQFGLILGRRRPNPFGFGQHDILVIIALHYEKTTVFEKVAQQRVVITSGRTRTTLLWSFCKF